MIISLDTEANGLDLRHGARPYLVTICDESHNNTWWEWDVDPYTRKVLAPKKDLSEIQDVIDDADSLVLQNPKFDQVGLDLLFRDNGLRLRWPWRKVYDTLLAGHLLATNQPHDLTSMALVYLGVDIQPLEDAVEKATRDARALVKRLAKDQEEYAKYRLAKEGLPEMPSAKPETKGNKKKGTPGSSPWKLDMWLCRLLAEQLGYPEDHSWHTVCSDYANGDSGVTLPLFLRQKQLLEEQGLWQIYLERLKVLPIVVAMEGRGVTIHKGRLRELAKEYQADLEKAGRLCTNLAASYNHELELPKSGNNKSLTSFVFDVLKLESTKKTDSGAPSMDKEVLEHWEDSLPPRSKPLTFIRALRGKRQKDTSLTYMAGYERFWLPLKEQDWYVLHPSLNPTGTGTLRWSSQSPNEQNISKKGMPCPICYGTKKVKGQECSFCKGSGEDPRTLRYCFGPAPGREWWSLDYENLELRIPGFESGEKKMIELFERPEEPPFFGSYHLLNASIVFPDLFWPLAEEKGAFKEKYKATYYQWIKNGGFAKQYGAQPPKVDTTMHCPGAYAKLASAMPKMEALNRAMIDYANKHGYVETIPDKTVDPKRGYPIQCTRSRWGNISPTIPLNYHVQSTAMWCTMKAMIRCQEYLKTLKDHHIALQVHDEMVFDFPAGGKKNLPIVQKVQRLMEQSGDDIGIPLRVSVTYHPRNWSESEKVT